MIDLDSFIAKWTAADGSERANAQLFVGDLCDLLDLPRPDPAREDTAHNAYVFERRVDRHHRDGSTTPGFIDLYRRGAFVLEAKSIADAEHTKGWDTRMTRAYHQATGYVHALPASEGRPPFLILLDVGRGVIELYAEFTRSGGSYTAFPDPRHHRLRLADLREEPIRERLRAIWQDPDSLDPSRHAARVTREIADRLAGLARSLETPVNGGGHDPRVTAEFLMRCLFTMFAEDVGLLPKDAFTDLLHSVRDNPAQFVPLTEHLWRDMNTGSDFSVQLRAKILRFNGGLFKSAQALPLDRAQLDQLLAAARADWRHVEPAIFGTLLERALNPVERHKLGAHYTPRAYVERLVLPTVIEPLRDDWSAVQAAAYTLDRQGKHDKAIQQVEDFHRRLCATRVLDPACGSGNFLYVTLEHMKRLEGEVLNTLHDMGQSQGLLQMEGISVDPHRFLGLEVNPRAAAIAEMVLWIGYLQWHFRTQGNVEPPQPVLKDFHNIENRDAVLAWDDIEFVTDEAGKPLSRWDGRTTRTDPLTGREVPDEHARVPLERYLNPRPASWPAAEFVVGNPPFIGAGPMRQALGDGYVEALRGAWKAVPESADFVMYWWHLAAETARAGKLRRFGFITTNSLRQTFNRRVLQAQMSAKNPVSLVFAIPDHPWVDAGDGAAVRIAMTVAEGGEREGVLHTLTAERNGGGEGREVELRERSGKLFSDLNIGANVAAAPVLRANGRLANRGVQLIGSGFIVTPEEAAALSPNTNVIRAYMNGRDLMQTSRDVRVIDLFGHSVDEVRREFPSLYQWVHDRVKPERDQNNRASYRDNWWIFGEPRKDMREAMNSLPRYIATVETSKHRVFTFLDRDVLPDNKLVNIALDDAHALGVLSSRVHVLWALASGSNLGVGNDPVYVKTRCFETFPFPTPDAAQAERIRDLAEQLDAHRKARQAAHPGLTLTAMYNVLDKLRASDGLHLSPVDTAADGTPPPLTDKERTVYEQGLIAILKQLHDELDAAVFAAYGWSDLCRAYHPTAPDGHAALCPSYEARNLPPVGWAKDQRDVPISSDGQHPGARATDDAPDGHAALCPSYEAGDLPTVGWAKDQRDVPISSDGQHPGASATGNAPDGHAALCPSYEGGDIGEHIRAVDEAVLQRLVDLNAERAAEEARGLVRWLRPDYQNPQGDTAAEQTEAELAPTETVAATAKAAWPKDLPAQIQAVRAALQQSPAAVTPVGIARQFKAAPAKKVAELLDTLVALGQCQRAADRYTAR
ncbi:MAG: class I SAM-dependent DNA methyltransferase [Gammaproteobacteria bacterium]|nr:class I SAM-dependent DNA methyltransferase [Gammaproteobacteria bacterium]